MYCIVAVQGRQSVAAAGDGKCNSVRDPPVPAPRPSNGGESLPGGPRKPSLGHATSLPLPQRSNSTGKQQISSLTGWAWLMEGGSGQNHFIKPYLRLSFSAFTDRSLQDIKMCFSSGLG